MEFKNIKERYPGYFVNFSEKLLKDAVLVLDTNIYLSVIQYPTELSERIISIFQDYNSKSKLFVPGTVADEVIKQLDFHLRRIDSQYITIDEKLDKTLVDIEKIFKDQGKKTFPIKEPKEIIDLLKKHFEELKKEIKDKEEEKKDTKKLRETIVNLMSKVGENYTDEEKKKLKPYFDEKIKLGLFPGGRDSNKDEITKYNDAYIWKQTIDFSKDQKQDIIFVTVDFKDDWWNIDKDTQKRIAKKSMINEFMISTGQKIQLLTLDDFFKNYNKTLPSELKMATQYMKNAISYIQNYNFTNILNPVFENINTVSKDYFKTIADAMTPLSLKFKDFTSEDYWKLVYPYLTQPKIFYEKPEIPDFSNALNLQPDFNLKADLLSNSNNKFELDNMNEKLTESNMDDKNKYNKE